MADPLSVSASIVGLVTISAQLYTLVHDFIVNVQDAPSLARSVCSELHGFRTALNSLAGILSHTAFKLERASLIAADNVVVTLTDAVLLFSDLESTIKPLVDVVKGEYRLLDKVRWTLRKGEVIELVTRLQWHKQTITMQLSIIQCWSDLQAKSEAEALSRRIGDQLAKQKNLASRIESLEDSVYPQLTEALSALDEEHLEPEAVESSLLSTNENTSTPDLEPGQVDSVPPVSEPEQREFERELMRSRLYRRTKHREEDMSLRDQTLKTGTMSMLSEISLAQLSIISVVRLPVYARDIVNGSSYPDNVVPWDELSAEPVHDLPGQSRNDPYFQHNRQPKGHVPSRSKFAGLRISLRPNPSGRRLADSSIMEGRNATERALLACVSRQDLHAFRQCWLMFDPERTGYISKQATPRLLGEFSGIFRINIYEGDFTVANILETCKSAIGIGHGIDLAKLNSLLSHVPVEEIRRRRVRFRYFYTELLAAADPDRGISVQSLRATILHYQIPNSLELMAADYRERRMIRLQRLQDMMDRETVINFFEFLYWSRQFNRRRERTEDSNANEA